MVGGCHARQLIKPGINRGCCQQRELPPPGRTQPPGFFGYACFCGFSQIINGNHLGILIVILLIRLSGKNKLYWLQEVFAVTWTFRISAFINDLLFTIIR
jgi:hypothetical protein